MALSGVSIIINKLHYIIHKATLLIQLSKYLYVLDEDYQEGHIF